MMKILVGNQFTTGISVISHIDEGNILTGNENGKISLWKYWASSTLEHIRTYNAGCKMITSIVSFLKNGFISINQVTEIRIWDINSETCNMILDGGRLQNIDSAIVLTNNLLVISGYCSLAWQCFHVWDLDAGTCIFEGQQTCHRPHGMELAITAQGFLVATGYCSSEICVWQINRSECKIISQGETDRIYSMTVLLTGEIVTGNHDLHFYKISYDRGIYKYKTVKNGNVIYRIFPIGGYKFLTVDRSSCNSGTVKLWNYFSEDYDYKVLGNSWIVSQISWGHIVLEQQNTILSVGEDKIMILKTSEGIFHFPKQLAEIRKNARILSQAYRTGTSFFANLPKEITLNIVTLTSNVINQYEKKVSGKIAQNYIS